MRRVEDDEQDIDAGRGGARHAVQQLAERPDRLVEAGRVKQHELSARVLHDAADGVARRLLHGADDGHLFADHLVDDGGFSGVRASYDADHRRFAHRSLRLLWHVRAAR